MSSDRSFPWRMSVNLMSGRVVLGGAILALSAILVTAWLVGRRRSAWVLLTNVLALGVTCVLTTSALGLASNRQMGWVKSSNDLWALATGGTPDSGAAITVDDSSVSEAPASEDGALPDSVAAHPGDSVWQAGFTYDASTSEWHASVAGPASGLDRSVRVWTPSDYSPTSSTTYNVVVFIHGYPGSDEGAASSLGVATAVQQLQAAGQLGPTIFVVADLSMSGQEPDCVDIDGHSAVETYVTRDLISSIRTNFPNVSSVRSGWSLAGISAGGYCAPVLYMRHRDIFSAVMSLGGYDAPSLGALSRADNETKRQFTISQMISDATGSPLHMYFAGTTGDSASVALVEDVSAAARSGDDITTELDQSGGHSWGTWAGQFPAAMQWWSTTSAREASDAQSGGSTAAADDGSTLATSAASSPFALTGWATLVSSVLLSMVLIVGCLIVGPLTTRGNDGTNGGHPLRRGYSLRLVLVALAAVAMDLTGLMMINVDQGFFSSWADFAANWSTLV